MSWHRTSTTGAPPVDPVGCAVADALGEILRGTHIELAYHPTGEPGPPLPVDGAGVATAGGPGPHGWERSFVLRLPEGIERIAREGQGTSIAELLDVLPAAAVRATSTLPDGVERLSPPIRRALRDMLATEVLAAALDARVGPGDHVRLVGETVEYLIELSGLRVEAHDLTHGVVIADVLHDTPRLELHYPRDVRSAKRAPLLFDGQRSVLVVDPQGRARTELQRHHLDRIPGSHGARVGPVAASDSGALVSEVTRRIGGLGFFVRTDRSIWTFVDGRPLLVRRGEHWTAFPVELTDAIANMIGGGDVAALVAGAAFLISAQPLGAILAIVDDAEALGEVVPAKDRYDLRHAIDPLAMRTETRLHHLIDAGELDEYTLARLATLDGATVLDAEGRLLAYGAIVTSTDSQHEGARTAAARTLSETATVVLKVSVDGDITIFRGGRVVSTLLGRPHLRSSG